MVRAVDHGRLEVDHRETGLAPGQHRFPDSGVDRGDVLARDRAADDLVLEERGDRALDRRIAHPLVGVHDVGGRDFTALAARRAFW